MEYYQPPPLPQKKDHTLLKILAAGIGCLVLVSGIAAFLLYRFYFYARGPSKMLEDHIRAINEGNYELAYTHFTEDLKEDVSLREFREQLDEFSSLLPTRDTSFSHVKIVNKKAAVEGTMTGRDGSIFPVQYELIQEKGVWKISNYQWTSPGERIFV
jgi:hypothetical protein